MRKLKAIPWSTVAVLAILAVLIISGHNGRVTTSLVAVVAIYLGLDLSVMHRFRVPAGKKELHDGRD